MARQPIRVSARGGTFARSLGLVGTSRGCLGPGRAADSSVITLEADLPASVDIPAVITRQATSAAGITHPTARCSVMLDDHEDFKRACGPGHRLLSESDEAVLRRIWSSGEITPDRPDRRRSGRMTDSAPGSGRRGSPPMARGGGRGGG